MLDFYCNKRFDISFEDFHKLIKLVLPSTYGSKETRGIYKVEYQPCNIIELFDKNQNNMHIACIYCWLGQKGLTVLADTPLTVSLCVEVCKEIKQNPEDWKSLSYPLIDEQLIIDELLLNNLLIYKQINAKNDTNKLIIKEYNNDECSLEFFKNPDSLRLSGAYTSLLTSIQLIIQKILNNPDNLS